MSPRKRPMPEQTVLVIVGGVAIAVAVVVPWLGWSTAARVDDTVPRPGGPGNLLSAFKEFGWPSAATPWAVGYLVAILVLAGAVGFLVVDRRRRRGPLAARIAELPTDPAGLKRYTTGCGPMIGHVVGRNGTSGPAVRMTIEDQGTVVAGPRTGKTSSIAIPAARDWRGPLLATSNKSDIYDGIRTHRERIGRVWLFDPQGLAQQSAPTWWWNPLEMATTVSGARRLASIWSHATRDAGAKTDAYFDTAGEELLAQLILAAAWHPQRAVTLVYDWASRPDDMTPEDVLRGVTGLEAMATGLASNRNLPDKQRSGVYATAQRAIAWLADPEIRQWVTDPDGQRPCWSAESLAHSTDTLVSLSREGDASAAPLVTSLTAAVLQATERTAAATPGGRLRVPLLGLLDEAANVCRWRDLPDLYSHYGSRGIVLVSFFQSWAQMVAAFGSEGAEKLWSSANVRVYGGGVNDTTFLRRLSELAGEHDELHWSSSYTGPSGLNGSGRRSRSDSTQLRRVATLDVATLGALPTGHAFVVLSAARPVVVRLVPYFARERNQKRARR